MNARRSTVHSPSVDEGDAAASRDRRRVPASVGGVSSLQSVTSARGAGARFQRRSGQELSISDERARGIHLQEAPGDRTVGARRERNGAKRCRIWPGARSATCRSMWLGELAGGLPHRIESPKGIETVIPIGPPDEPTLTASKARRGLRLLSAEVSQRSAHPHRIESPTDTETRRPNCVNPQLLPAPHRRPDGE